MPSASVSSAPSSESLLAIQIACPVPPHTPVIQRRLCDLNKPLPSHLCYLTFSPMLESAPVVVYAAQDLAGQALSFLYIVPRKTPHLSSTSSFADMPSIIFCILEAVHSSLGNPRQSSDGKCTEEGYQGQESPVGANVHVTLYCIDIGGSDRSTWKKSERNQGLYSQVSPHRIGYVFRPSVRLTQRLTFLFSVPHSNPKVGRVDSQAYGDVAECVPAAGPSKQVSENEENGTYH